jgi:hypothetical protein
MFETPILFLIFNRPDLTYISFNRIREIKPKFLFVAADGPRFNIVSDFENCYKVRKIVTDNIDWECNVRYNFRDVNLGCGLAVSSSINWFFEHVEEGIILEDDCLPNLSFFHFCEDLLFKYRNNSLITHIGGHNSQMGFKRGFGDYYFSRYTHIWGWATWKRAWKFYNFSTINLNLIFTHSSKRIFPITLLKELVDSKLDTWDIQWQYCNFINNKFSIIPNVNLVDNIGFHRDATHTNFSKPGYFKKNHSSELLLPLQHPKKIKFNKIADEFTASYIYKLCKPSIILRFYNRLSKRFIN